MIMYMNLFLSSSLFIIFFPFKFIQLSPFRNIVSQGAGESLAIPDQSQSLII